MNQEELQRMESIEPSFATFSPEDQFRLKSGNEQFRVSLLTWASLAVLVVLYPAQALLFGAESIELLKSLTEPMRMVLLLSTIAMLWGIFLLILYTTLREKTGLAGIGFTRFRPVHIAWGLSFLLGAFLFLSGLAWALGKIGLPMPGEIGLLIPETLLGKLIWVATSITAGVCEEAAFRGYLMTRLRLILGSQSWVLPTIISSLAFGICHSYQGIPGLIVITVYGALFSLLYIRTGSLWPCIIAHFFQDFLALFIPQ